MVGTYTCTSLPIKVQDGNTRIQSLAEHVFIVKLHVFCFVLFLSS